MTKDEILSIARGTEGVVAGPWSVHRYSGTSTLRMVWNEGRKGLCIEAVPAVTAEHIARLSPEVVSELCRLALIGLEQAWQPIETAPKDGTEILCGDFSGIMGDDFQQVVSWDVWKHDDETESEGWAICDGPMRPPSVFTHWRPLPTPPSNQENEP